MNGMVSPPPPLHRNGEHQTTTANGYHRQQPRPKGKGPRLHHNTTRLKESSSESESSSDDEEAAQQQQQQQQQLGARQMVHVCTDPYVYRTCSRVHLVEATTVLPNIDQMRDMRFDALSVQRCRQRSYEHHRALCQSARYPSLFPDAFATCTADRLISIRISGVSALTNNGRNVSITRRRLENSLMHMMVELEMLRNAEFAQNPPPVARLLEVGAQLMKQHRVTLSPINPLEFRCDRVTAHWFRVLGMAKYFNVHNREQKTEGQHQLIERRWPLHPLFLWMYATRPLFSDPTRYAFSKQFGLYDAIQLQSFVVILASLCNVNEWYIDVEQLENALWRPHETDYFDIYNHLHRFIDMFHHSNEVLVDAIVNQGLAAIVGRFLTMRVTRYMRTTFYQIMKRWQLYHIQSGAHGEFIRQHRWVLTHFTLALDDAEGQRLLAEVNTEYVDLKALVERIQRRFGAAFVVMNAKNASLYPASTSIECFVVHFYRMVMDLFQLDSRIALMGASCLAHDLQYLRDRRISVVIPSDFYIDRNFERYDLLGRHWCEHPEGPQLNQEEYTAQRNAIQDPETVTIMLPPPSPDASSSSSSSSSKEDLEIQRYRKRMMRQRAILQHHPDCMALFGHSTPYAHIPLERDGVLSLQGPPEHTVTQPLIPHSEIHDDEEATLANQRLETLMLRYIKIVAGEVPNLCAYRNDNLPAEYHEASLRQHGQHQRRNRTDPTDLNAAVFLDVTDMELIYNAILATPRTHFVRALPDNTTVGVTLVIPPDEDELDDADMGVASDTTRYQRRLPNVHMRHAFFQHYTLSLPYQWRRPVLATMRNLLSGLAPESFQRIDEDNARNTHMYDYMGRTEFLRRLIRQHRPDHERVDVDDYNVDVEECRARKRKRNHEPWSNTRIHHTFTADRRCDAVNAHNYSMAVRKDGGEVSDFRFNPRFCRLTALGLFIAVVEQEGSFRKLVHPKRVHMIPFVDLDEPANPQPRISTVPYLTLPRVDLPVYVRWHKELNHQYALTPPSRIVGFYQSFFIFLGDRPFATKGLFHMPPLPIDEREPIEPPAQQQRTKRRR